MQIHSHHLACPNQSMRPSGYSCPWAHNISQGGGAIA
jgi:hypothetical protein